MKTNQMMKVVFATALALTMTGCAAGTGTQTTNTASAYKTKLSGQWKDPNKDEYLDFHKDGTVNIYTYDDQTNQYVSQSAQYVVNENDVRITTQDNQTYTISDINDDDAEVDGEKWNKVAEAEEVQDDQIENTDEDNTESDDESYDEEEYNDDYDDEDEEDEEEQSKDDELNEIIQGCWVSAGNNGCLINCFQNGTFWFYAIDTDSGILISYDKGSYSIEGNVVTVQTSDGQLLHTEIQGASEDGFVEVTDDGSSTFFDYKVSADEVKQVVEQCNTNYYVSMNEFVTQDWQTIIQQRMQAEEDEQTAQRQQQQNQKQQEEAQRQQQISQQQQQEAMRQQQQASDQTQQQMQQQMTQMQTQM